MDSDVEALETPTSSTLAIQRSIVFKSGSGTYVLPWFRIGFLSLADDHDEGQSGRFIFGVAITKSSPSELWQLSGVSARREARRTKCQSRALRASVLDSRARCLAAYAPCATSHVASHHGA